jgi:hypothetical protein
MQVIIGGRRRCLTDNDSRELFTLSKKSAV